MDALSGVAYAIDIDCRIAAIGRRGWALFAAENGAPELADRDLFIGCDLFAFISGEDVREGYRRILKRIAQGEPQIVMPCRCDGPGIVRDMRLSISPLRRGRNLVGFLFHSVELAEHVRPPIGLYRFRSFPESVPILGMCSLCERVCPTEDCSNLPAAWMDAETYYARGGTSQVRISHTVCPQCFARWVQGWTGAPPPEF